MITAYILFLFAISVQAQTSQDNLRKYWYYRHRLTSDFLKAGLGRGESIPAAHRNCSQTPCSGMGKFKWGDATIYLGWYISVLATEYKLLHDNGTKTEKTAEELYFALEAFNRLDEHAESYFRCPVCAPSPQSGDLNGFFIRDDVTSAFVTSNTDHFNSNPASRLTMDGLMSSSLQDNLNHTDVNDNPSPLPPQCGTHDQAWEIMMGCALVAKLVPAGASFQNIPFRDSIITFTEEGKAIVHRLITWMNKNGDWATRDAVNNQCIMGITYNCICNKPVKKEDCEKALTYTPGSGYGNIMGGSWEPNHCKNDMNCGSAAWPFSWGAAEAAEFVTGNRYDHSVNGRNFKCLWQAFQCGAFPGSILVNINDEYNKIMTLAAIGHSWKKAINPPCITGIMTSIENIILDLTPLPCITTFNQTGVQLSQIAVTFDKHIYPLLHQVLHGGKNPFIVLGTFEFFLNVGPVEGPWNFGGGDRAHFQWSGTQRWRSPEQNGDATPSNPGEYNGLDYMLLHNLYYLQRLSGNGKDSEGKKLPPFVNPDENER